MMEVIILGSGTCVPSVRRAGPATCVRVDGETILIDSASGTLRQLAKAGISMDALDMIFYTHLHPDHISEFIPFVFATKYSPIYKRPSPVTVLAARGFMDFYNALKSAFGQWVINEEKINIEEIPTEMPASMQFPPLIIKTSPVKHTPLSLAYRIESSSGESVVISGDTDYCLELTELAKGCDLLVLECAAPEHAKVEGHLIPSEAGRIAQDAGAKELLLTHFYPNCDGSDLISPCKKEYSGPVILAEDLMRLII
jgi:ribonuclease BN (tRNA processing enzyme)